MSPPRTVVMRPIWYFDPRRVIDADRRLYHADSCHVTFSPLNYDVTKELAPVVVPCAHNKAELLEFARGPELQIRSPLEV